MTEQPDLFTDSCTEDCEHCSGEYCEQHVTDPCDCDVLDRHRPAVNRLRHLVLADALACDLADAFSVRDELAARMREGLAAYAVRLQMATDSEADYEFHKARFIELASRGGLTIHEAFEQIIAKLQRRNDGD